MQFVKIDQFKDHFFDSKPNLQIFSSKPKKNHFMHMPTIRITTTKHPKYKIISFSWKIFVDIKNI